MPSRKRRESPLFLTKLHKLSDGTRRTCAHVEGLGSVPVPVIVGTPATACCWAIIGRTAAGVVGTRVCSERERVVV